MLTLRRFAALTTALCAIAAHAGLKFTSENKRKGKTSTSTVQLEGKNVRMEMTKDGSSEPTGAFIGDGDNKKLVIINYAKKEYHELTQEQMKQFKAKMEAAMATMKERMAKMPPEQRKQMEAAMGQMKNPSPMADEKYVRASGGKTIAGYKCDLYTVEAEGKHVADTCLIPWGDLKIDREELKRAMQSLAESWDMGGEKAANPMLKAWGMAIGLPAWRKSVKEDEGEITETTLLSISRGSVPRSAFEPPAGYTKKEIGRE